MTERYQVSTDNNDIEHGCCYDFAVVDTAQPHPYRPGHFCMVFECRDQTTADHIAMLLNKDPIL